MGTVNFLERLRKEKIKKIARPVAKTFIVFATLLAGYIVIAPFEPMIVYELYAKNNISLLGSEKTTKSLISVANAATIKTATSTAQVKTEQVKKDNRLVISMIGVNAHISNNASPKKGLNEGVWMDPGGSTPDQGGNTIIAGHRWKYRPPNSTTFYLLDKVKVGDELSISWKDKKYVYLVKEIRIVNPDNSEVLEQTEKPTLTVYTCTPLYSMKHRLVLIAELQ